MATGSSSASLVATRYISALLDMAAESKQVEKIEKDMQTLSAMLDGSEDLRALIANPQVSRTQQQDGILAVAEKAKFQQLTGNFLGVVADNGRIDLLPLMIKKFGEELRRRRGEIAAKVESAVPLTAKQTDELQKQLSKAVGTNVALEVSVNAELLGGLVVTVGSQMIDDSVRRKLERLQRAMSSGSNENRKHLKEVG